ncbi:hypothetical protein C942_04129 [Photobacterium marinum]|uniref:Uncharacterized protein n=1 Tax=Photobacterium marinum TaxID=1056511 RepID=L8J635_9GAMM|nr:hypothetical protein [Photobacterium marinum]ELR63089.1 hypothetical protein C942_04129 [Photobacterium marinum]
MAKRRLLHQLLPLAPAMNPRIIHRYTVMKSLSVSQPVSPVMQP